MEWGWYANSCLVLKIAKSHYYATHTHRHTHKCDVSVRCWWVSNSTENVQSFGVLCVFGCILWQNSYSTRWTTFHLTINLAATDVYWKWQFTYNGPFLKSTNIWQLPHTLLRRKMHQKHCVLISFPGNINLNRFSFELLLLRQNCIHIAAYWCVYHHTNTQTLNGVWAKPHNHYISIDRLVIRESDQPTNESTKMKTKTYKHTKETKKHTRFGIWKVHAYAYIYAEQSKSAHKTPEAQEQFLITLPSIAINVKKHGH